MVLKLIALTPSKYLVSSWNRFDMVIVIISIIELIASLSGDSANSNLAVLRAFRLVIFNRFIRLKIIISVIFEVLYFPYINFKWFFNEV